MAFSSSSLRGGRGRKFKSEINVVPYIDVMLVLLIIFMVVPPANSPSVINLPSAEKSALPPDDYIQVVLKPNATLSIGFPNSPVARVASRFTRRCGHWDATASRPWLIVAAPARTASPNCLPQRRACRFSTTSP